MDVNQRIVDKQSSCLAEFAKRLRAKLGTHIKEDDLAKHARDPFGLHSDDLARVLQYARSQPIPGKLVVVRLDSFNAYGIAALSGSRDER